MAQKSKDEVQRIKTFQSTLRVTRESTGFLTENIAQFVIKDLAELPERKENTQVEGLTNVEKI